MKQNKNLVNISSKIILSIVYLLSILFFYFILKLAILPTKYLLILIIVYLIILGIVSLLVIPKKIKVKAKMSVNIFNVILIVILSLGNVYMAKTLGFFDNINSNEYKSEDYYLIVLKESNYYKIEDLKNKKIGIHNNNADTYNKAVSQLEKSISFNKIEENDFTSVKNDLFEKKVEAIFISSSLKSIIDSEDSTFKDKIRIISTITSKIKLELESATTNKDLTKDSFNIYISGIDTYGSISSVSLSDVNIIMTVNPKTNQVLLTHIPRDYYVQLNGTTGYKDKLTHAGIYGIDMSMKTIENLLDIKIDYYIRLNFTTLIKVIDAIGGVNVYSDYNFSVDGYKYVKGINQMDGNKALRFARERKTLPGGDRDRGKNQQRVIEAIIKKLSSSTAIITRYTTILDSLKESFNTNITLDKISQLVRFQLDKMPSWSVDSINLDGSDSSNYTYSYGNQKLYVMVPDQNSINNAKQKINKIID